MAAAKRAAYVVTAIDAYADKQTVELADKTIVVAYGKNGFNADALLAAISNLDASQYIGFVYGSGFEAQPELLQKIADIIPLLGNAPATVRAVKTAAGFFSALQQLNVAYPAVFDALPNRHACHHSDVYLQKFAGGCGGTHIKIVSSDDADSEANHYTNYYYQQYIDGRSVSLLFIADSQKIEVVGFNEQWLSPATEMPFRYGGAVSRIMLPQAVQQQLIDAAEKLSIEFGLIGLNSLDAIVRGDVAYVLEINPRLSATVDLYAANLPEEDDVNLLDRHVNTCLKNATPQHGYAQNLLKAPKNSNAHAIVYASSNIAIPATFLWPDWVVDNPHQSNQQDVVKILAGEPVCTVLAVADNADAAKQLAHTRVKMIQNLLSL